MDNFLQYGLIIVAVATIFLLGTVIYRASSAPLTPDSFAQSTIGTDTQVKLYINSLCAKCQQNLYEDKECYLLNATITSGIIEKTDVKAVFEFVGNLTPGTHELKFISRNQQCIIRKLA